MKHLSLNPRFSPLLAVILLFSPFTGASAGTVQIDESMLAKLAYKENPTALNIQSAELQAQQEEAGFQEGLGWSLLSAAKYQDSKEKAFAAFIPTFGPTSELSLGVKKNWLSGVSSQVSVFNVQQSTLSRSIDGASRTGLRAGFTIDLWKNFLGRLNRAKLDTIELRRERATQQAIIQGRNFELNLRKVYWSLVANQESLKIAEGLLKLSEEQLKDAKRRLRSSVADAGEVARYEAQVASRRAQILGTKYQMRLMLEGLRKQLPSLSEQELVLANYNVDDAVQNVVLCAAAIQAKAEIPWGETRYDELIDLLEREHQSQIEVTNKHSDIDLALTTNMQVSGVAQGLSNSIDDLNRAGRFGYEVGLALTVPLGGSSGQSENIQREIEKRKFLAEQKKLRSELASQHIETGQVVALLSEALASQKHNTEMLQTTLKESNRKFRQARISLSELIQDQDALQSSMQSEVETKLAVIHRLLDYFVFFTESDCKLNRIVEGA